MHDEWVRHRDSNRFFRNMQTIVSSGVALNLKEELAFVTMTAAFIVVANCFIDGYTGLDGSQHGAILGFLPGPLALPSLPFSISLPALSLLLVFRTNTAYGRWNEARTLWGGVVNTCRNVARQSNAFYPDTPQGDDLRERMVANTAAFAYCLRAFLRGPDDNEKLRSQLMDLEAKGQMPRAQVEACMAAANRPMFQLAAMSANLKEADIGSMDRARIDTSISLLADLTGACERIFKSPVPLVYTRLTARFLTTFLVLLPMGLWQVTGESWNHWATIPATFVIAFFLFGIEEIGIQIEEPFSILPLEALCDGAIAATMKEMNTKENLQSFDFGSPSQPRLDSSQEESTRDAAGTVDTSAQDATRDASPSVNFMAAMTAQEAKQAAAERRE